MQQWLTVDELAHRVGMTTRNIRAHQTRGLLPPPELRGRTGYYGPDHVARLELVKEMQGAGFSLASIKALLDAAPAGTAEEALRFQRLLRTPWQSEEPEILDLADLAHRFGPHLDPDTALRALELGTLEPLEDGRMRVPSPTLLRAAEDVTALGIPLCDVLDVYEDIAAHTAALAERLTALFVDGIWKPFEDAGCPAERWPEVRAALEQLRPIASRVVLAAFHLAMTAATEKAFGRELARIAGTGLDAGRTPA